MRTWLMLTYKIPREPTAGRVFIWRKLKQLGAILVHDAVWILPATPRTQEQFQWLCTEINELGGESLLWKSELAFASQESELVSRFEAEIEPGYREILKALNHKKRDLAALGRKYVQTQSQDYFKSELGERVRKALLAASRVSEDNS